MAESVGVVTSNKCQDFRPPAAFLCLNIKYGSSGPSPTSRGSNHSSNLRGFIIINRINVLEWGHFIEVIRYLEQDRLHVPVSVS